MDKKECLTMTSNAKHVAQWWRYRTLHQSPVLHVEPQWSESGQYQELNLTGQGFTQQISKGNNVPIHN